ncbi:MAG TPA: hypothetical protein VKH15_10265 [Candidatus Acidoferrum sp.]|nr:hypothetical protein [Candidatus Acidoferrum sp.]
MAARQSGENDDPLNCNTTNNPSKFQHSRFVGDRIAALIAIDRGFKDFLMCGSSPWEERFGAAKREFPWIFERSQELYF